MDDGFDPRDQAAYDRLQAKLVPLWSSIDHLNTDEQTIVVVPSADIDVEVTASELQAYEERYLFLLFLLRQPRARMVYVTGQPIDPRIVDYYLDLLPGVIHSNARKRLSFVSPGEARFRPLSRKVLDRPRTLARIKDLIPDPDRAHLVPFMTTWDDRELAMRLGIPMYGADPVHREFGTKTEGRRLFAEAGVSHPDGAEGLHTRREVAEAVVALRRRRPDIQRVVVKLNEGVSGFGNATLSLVGLEPEATADEIHERMEDLPVDEHVGGIDGYFLALEREGGIVEEMVEGVDIASPSVQLRITPLGDVEVLSTHDQILGGASGQVFLGSRFPADPSYAVEISRSARRVGERLAARGVIGRFAIDYVVAKQDDGTWEEHAIELNLRKGGTTHPFLTLQFLTDGTYDEERGVFVAPSGVEKSYVSSDHARVDGLETLTTEDLLEIALMRGLHFDGARQVGSVFHMLSAMATHGSVGVTSVGDSPDDAHARYDEVLAVLTDEIGAVR
jgi:PGM1 C-terminal domain